MDHGCWWTIDADGYAKHKAELVERIKTYMEHYNEYLPIVRQQVKKLQTEFFSGNELYGAISSERWRWENCRSTIRRW